MIQILEIKIYINITKNELFLIEDLYSISEIQIQF
jgi:hypothetical protein